MSSADPATAAQAREAADDCRIDRSEGPAWAIDGLQAPPSTSGSSRGSIVLAEAPLGQPIPEYARRRESSGELLRGADGTVVFTDSGHTSFIWALRSTFGGLPARYTEFRLSDGAVGLHRFLRESATAFEWPLSDVETASSCTRVTLIGIFRRLPSSMVLPAPDLQSVQDWIEELDDITAVRTLWRAAVGTRVCDPSIDGDGWLLGAASVLEAVLLAILDRMRAWVADAVALEPGRRPEYLADLRNAVAAADESTHETARAFIRHWIVQRSLFGAARSRQEARRCRRRLLRYAVLRPTPGAYFDTNITSGLPPPACCGTPPLDDRYVSPGVTGIEERELLRIAREELKETRLRSEGYDREWLAAARQIAKRERSWSRSTGGPARLGRRGSDVAVPPDNDLHHRWIHEARPFDVIRPRP